MPTTLSVIPSTSVKVRWKEPYASEALNKKFAAVVPAGVYRGLRLEESPSVLSVDLVEDSVHGDHVAVVEDIEGNSVTYRDISSGRLTLDLSSFGSGDTVVVAVHVSYQIGSDTEADIRGYSQADFDLLNDTDRHKLVVLGSVVRSASGVIPAANIGHDGRDVPFLNRANESVPWNPMVRNGSFELGDTGGTFANASPFWETSSSNGDFTIGPVDTDSHLGDKSLEVEAVTSTGSVTATAKQTLYAPVIPGRQMRVRLYKRGLQAATGSPVGRVRFSFEDKDQANDTDVDVNFDIDTVDASFVDYEGVIFVPDAMTVVKTIEVTVAGSYGSLGPCIRLDGVQVWCEVDAEDWLVIGSSLSAEVQTDSLFLGNRQTGVSAAKFSFDGTDAVLESRNPSDPATSLIVPGGVYVPGTGAGRLSGVAVLGGDLLASEAQANTPRITANPSVAMGAEYTLMWESVPVGGQGYRKYVKSDGTLTETSNCSWDNTTNLWTKDVVSVPSTKIEFGGSSYASLSRAADADWSDTGWDLLQSPFSWDVQQGINLPTDEIMMTPFMAQQDSGDFFVEDDSNGEVFGHIVDPGIGITTGINWAHSLNGVSRGGYTLSTSTAINLTRAAVYSKRRFRPESPESDDTFIRVIHQILWEDSTDPIYMCWGMVPTSTSFNMTTTTSAGAYFFWDSAADTLYACTIEQGGAGRILAPLAMPADNTFHEFEMRFLGSNLTGGQPEYQYYINGLQVHTESITPAGTQRIGGFVLASEGNPSGTPSDLKCTFQGWYHRWKQG